MSDYAKTTNFTAKDSLTTGDPEKLILGADFDTEFNAIATAIATKYDTSDLASQAEAEAGTSSSKLMTPERTEQWGANWAAENAGMVGDIHALTDPGADTLLGWDNSASAVINFTLGDGLVSDGTAVKVNVGTGVIISSDAVALDLSELTTETALVDADFIICRDASGSHDAKITLANLVTTLEGDINHDSLVGFVSNEHIDHGSVSITAGDGLTGGGTIAASRTLNVVGGTGITANANDIEVTDGKVLMFNSAQTSSQVYISTSAPSGGSNGDIWLEY